MKFRAKLLELSSMRQFSNIITTVSKLSKTCIIRICHDKFYFILPEESGIPPYATILWAFLEKDPFFTSYNMLGDTDTNEIYLEIFTDLLASSLSSLKGGNCVTSMKIKLTDKASPCLTLELELASQAAHTQLCVHDVPVTVIPTNRWPDYQEPANQLGYDVSIEMPNIKIVRNVVDRMKKLSNKLFVNVKHSGKYSIGIKTDTADIETHFKDSHIHNISSENNEAVTSVCVDIKKYSNFLTCEAMNPSSVRCDIIKGHLLHQYLINGNFKLSYYLTAVEE